MGFKLELTREVKARGVNAVCVLDDGRTGEACAAIACFEESALPEVYAHLGALAMQRALGATTKTINIGDGRDTSPRSARKRAAAIRRLWERNGSGSVKWE
jgi:hypothetical protein